jgi:DNA-binding transcriptional MerR regulator
MPDNGLFVGAPLLRAHWPAVTRQPGWPAKHYPPSSAERVALIRLYQDAGFTLAEIGPMVATVSRGRQAWGRLAERKIAELDARIADAQRAKKLIKHALECPIAISSPTPIAAPRSRLNSSIPCSCSASNRADSRGFAWTPAGWGSLRRRRSKRPSQRSPHRWRARASDQLPTGRSSSEPSQPSAPPLTIAKKSRRPSLSAWISMSWPRTAEASCNVVSTSPS